MNLYSNFYLIFCFVLVLFACNDKPLGDLPGYNSHQVVVNGLMDINETALTFTRTQNLSEASNNKILISTYGIAVNNKPIDFSFRDQDSSYLIVHDFVAGDTLKLNIDAEGLPSVNAQAIFPNFLDSIKLELLNKTENYEFRLKFKDMFSQADYYWLSIEHQLVDTLKDSLIEKIETNLLSNSPYVFNSDLTNPNAPYRLFTDQGFNGQTISIDFSSDFAQFEKQNEHTKAYVLVSFHHISPEAYEFLKSLAQNKNIFGGPLSSPTNLYTNIENGLGILAFYKKFQLRF